MSDPLVTPCARCGQPCIHVRRCYSDEHRRAGLRRHYGRGLCHPCWTTAEARGELDEYPRSTWSREDLLEEWEFLQPELPADVSHTRRIKLAANRLGMSHGALEKALLRSGVRAS